MPQVSVIIPTFNRANYVTAAIDSVLVQTYTDYEIIVVDDGSTDNTQEVLQPYLDKIHYICQSNKGVSAARNTGIRAAKGEWLAFLDSDDEWMPDKLRVQIEDIQRFPSAILSCANVLFEGPGETTVNFFKECLAWYEQDSKLLERALFKTYACTPSVIVKRESAINAGLFDESFSIYEDIDLFFRVFTTGSIIVNPLPLVKAFRRSEGADVNLSGQFLKDKHKNYATLVRIFEKLTEFPMSPEQSSFARQRLSDSWFDLGLWYYCRLNRQEASRSFCNCFKACPSSKTFVKMVLGLSGRIGISWVEKRRASHRGFRRSEYYQNEIY